MKAMLKRHQPIPILQPGGYQPYAPAGGQMPGPALLAMLGGRTLGGINPQDAWRQMQATSNEPTLLSSLRQRRQLR
jgi:hypothetical protein